MYQYNNTGFVQDKTVQNTHKNFIESNYNIINDEN